MKKNVCFAVLTAMTAIALVGCGTQASVEEPKPAPQKVTVSVDTSALPKKYASVVEMAAKAVAGEYGDNLTELEENGVSTEFGISKGDTSFGYALKDLDGDGSDELLLGKNATPDFDGWDGEVFNIYTLKDDELYVLANGGERDSYYITEDGTVGNIASGSATDDTAYNYYKLNDKELKLVESIFTVSKSGSEEFDWYYTEKEPFTDLSNKISDAKACIIAGKYPADAIEFTAFVK